MLRKFIAEFSFLLYGWSGALSGSTNAEPANVASSFDNPGLDVGTQVVDDLVADYPQRQHTNLVCVQIGAGSMEAPQTSTVELGDDSNNQHQVDGSIGIAASAEVGPTPRVDDSTPESIVRISRKYSLADAVDGLLSKAPSDLHDVSSCPLSGDPDMGPEDSGAEVVLPCILESGLVHALPLSLSKQELDNLMPMSQPVACRISSTDSDIWKLVARLTMRLADGGGLAGIPEWVAELDVLLRFSSFVAGNNDLGDAPRELGM
ncbi:hypothetical protein Nepgr_005283 [Nepenthes gracilis]|uniref:Uncharacterized protein n=1 Tax=Nepenthes gracilis TaxID=150966 RepID=A0AAD3S3C9_NEPGR|nr:hypothetical protein Nepgr_005283 [Nepenthes gracilis]